MIIQPNYSTFITPTTNKLHAERQIPATITAKSADMVTISQAAREALSSTDQNTDPLVRARLEEIKAKGAFAKTAEDMDYLLTHDTKYAAIVEKANSGIGLTSDEIDYQQKAVGFINTMASLSPSEKQMYDDMVASGNSAAAEAMGNIAFIRATSGHTAAGANGALYDPTATKITASNVAKHFMHTIVDKSGESKAQFQALMQYLENRPTYSSPSTTTAHA